MITGINFLWKGFKIIISNDEDYTYFEYVSTKLPKLVNILHSLWKSDLTYSNEFKTSFIQNPKKCLKRKKS